MPESLDTIYSLGEAAERLRLNKNALARIARRTGNCSVTGRTVLFSESDLIAIWQEIRVEPTRRMKRVTAAPNLLGTNERLPLFLARRPAITVDKRVIGVLQWLSTQRMPKTSAQIARCGPRTIDELMRKNLVKNCGQDNDGLIKIAISPSGRDEVRKYERWLKKRKDAGDGR